MANKQPQVESPRALTAKNAYAAMPASARTLARLAEQLQAEQQAVRDKAVAAGAPKPPKVQTLAVIERRLKEWSRTFNWQGYVSAQEQARYLEEQDAISNARRETFTIQSQVTRGIFIRAMSNINALLEEDEGARGRYKMAVAVWEGMPLAERMDTKRPEQPRPLFGPYALVNLAKLALEGELVARTGLADILAEQPVSEAGLPPVLEIELAGSPPPLPPDPYESEPPPDEDVPPYPERAPALVSLPSTPPQLPADPADPADEREDWERDEEDWDE